MIPKQFAVFSFLWRSTSTAQFLKQIMVFWVDNCGVEIKSQQNAILA